MHSSSTTVENNDSLIVSSASTYLRYARNLFTITAVCTSFWSAALRAQSWQTVDEIHPGAYAFGLASDQDGRIFVAGRLQDASGITHAIVTKGYASGQSTVWGDQASDSFTSTIGSTARFIGVATARTLDGTGATVDQVVTTGVANGAQWLVRRSLDAGATWHTLDLYSYSANVVSGAPIKPVIDEQGKIYVAGTATESSKGRTTVRNILRIYANGSWTTVPLSFPVVSLTRSGGDLFALSNATTGTWQVRKSANGGLTWSAPVDEFRFDPSSSSIANDITADTAGNLYVVGRSHVVTTGGTRKSPTTFTERFWLVRKGMAAATQWSTIDIFAFDRTPVTTGSDTFGRSSWPYSVAADRDNNVYVTGVAVESQEGQHWVTRRLSGATGEWAISDDYVIAGSQDMQGNAVAPDPFGNVFAIGYHWTAGETHGWLVRCQLRPTQ